MSACSDAASASAPNTTLPDANTVRTSVYPRCSKSARSSADRIVIPLTLTPRSSAIHLAMS